MTPSTPKRLTGLIGAEYENTADAEIAAEGAPYEPELGQMIFGQPSQSFTVPPIMDAALEAIRAELQRVMWNLRQGDASDPFGNTAASFRCPTFTVCAYSWDDDLPQSYNFKHPASGVEISWYKYMGRGLSANQAITPDVAARVLTHCLAGLRAVEKGEHRYDEPGLYPDGPATAAAQTQPGDHP